MVWNSRRVGVVALGGVAAVVVAALAFVLVSHQGGTPTHTPSAKPAATHSPLVSPFTGERVPSLQRVLAVKIGNTVAERPATGLSKADLVYMLPVEGGLSRILAVFSSHYPPVVGPVRSAREDDLPWLRQFRRPAFAFSGATTRLLPVVEHARIVDLYAGRVRGYFRSANRIAPYNLYAHTRQLLAQSKRASVARD